MANRFQVNQHRLAYSFIASRDGDYCLICQRGPDKVELQIDHADNDPYNWEPDNLHLLCQEHNLGFRGVPVAEKLQIIQEHSAKNVYVLEKRYGSISTKVAKDTLDYGSGSVEMKANSMFEPVFTEWLLRNLPMPKREAINSGAHIAGCSPATCERYLNKLTSAAGPLQEFRNGMNVVTIDFKDDLKQPINDGPEPDKDCSDNAPEDSVKDSGDHKDTMSGNGTSEEKVPEQKGYHFRPPKGEIRN